MTSAARDRGLTLRHAALIAGVAYLLNPVSYAEISLLPRLIIPGNIEQTTQNIAARGGTFVAAILCYLVNFIGDIVIAWALYHLLAPVNRALSLLMAWFQLVYTAVGFVAMLNLVRVYNLLTTPYDLTVFGTGPLHAQVHFLLNSFRSDWSWAMILFAIHLVLLGYLIFRSSYIPRIIGILLVIDGLGWIIDCLQPYLDPGAHLGFLFLTFLGELVFMLWLLIRGWRIEEPAINQRL